MALAPGKWFERVDRFCHLTVGRDRCVGLRHRSPLISAEHTCEIGPMYKPSVLGSGARQIPGVQLVRHQAGRNDRFGKLSADLGEPAPSARDERTDQNPDESNDRVSQEAECRRGTGQDGVEDARCGLSG